MNRSSASDSLLPGWARAADGLTVVLALAVLYVIVFGGIRIGAVFSMSHAVVGIDRTDRHLWPAALSGPNIPAA